MDERAAESEGWERTMEFRWLKPWGLPPILQQKWTKWVHGYGEDTQEWRWIAVSTVEWSVERGRGSD